MMSTLSSRAPLRSQLPLSWLLLAAVSFACGGSASVVATTTDGAGLQNLFDVPVSGIGSDRVASELYGGVCARTIGGFNF